MPIKTVPLLRVLSSFSISFIRLVKVQRHPAIELLLGNPDKVSKQKAIQALFNEFWGKREEALL